MVFAGVEVTICIPDQWMYEEDRQLAPFRVAQVCDPHIFSFELVDSISEPVGTLEAVVDGARIYRNGNCYVRYIGSVQEDWKLGYARAEYGDKQHFVQVRRNEFSNRIPVKTVLNSLGLEHLTAMEGGFVFHCSFVARDNGAILFTAPSGTGKSTQADLWRDFRNAEIINGDRAAVCVKEGRVFAEGIPFSGSSSYCKMATLPVSAIVYLSQAPQTTIRKLRGMEAFAKIWEGVGLNTWIRQDVEKVSDAVRQVATEIPVYHLACTPDESAVIALEDVLRKQELV